MMLWELFLVYILDVSIFVSNRPSLMLLSLCLCWSVSPSYMAAGTPQVAAPETPLYLCRSHVHVPLFKLDTTHTLSHTSIIHQASTVYNWFTSKIHCVYMTSTFHIFNTLELLLSCMHTCAHFDTPGTNTKCNPNQLSLNQKYEMW